jgi:hypothetical protein
VLDSLIAIVGTLLGAVTAAALQHLNARAERDEELFHARVEAAAALAAAISTLRQALWHRGEAESGRAPDSVVQECRAEVRQARSEVSRPWATLQLLGTEPRVWAAADRMVQATYAMRSAGGRMGELASAREAALAAHDDFVRTAGLLAKARVPTTARAGWVAAFAERSQGQRSASDLQQAR